MYRDFKITGLAKIFLYTKLKLINLSSNTIPILLILFEIIFITDMLGITEILTSYLQVK